MSADFSKAALLRFLDTIGTQGLANPSTAHGFKVACTKILADLSTEEEGDVRKVDVDTAIRRFANKNPGTLSPSSLTEYGRRVNRAISEFNKYVENPAGFKPIGRGSSGSSKVKKNARKGRKSPKGGSGEVDRPHTPSFTPPTPSAGLTLAFPLRGDFLAQVVVPRDMKIEEAKRLSAFIMTLSPEYDPGL